MNCPIAPVSGFMVLAAPSPGRRFGLDPERPLAIALQRSLIFGAGGAWPDVDGVPAPPRPMGLLPTQDLLTAYGRAAWSGHVASPRSAVLVHETNVDRLPDVPPAGMTRIGYWSGYWLEEYEAMDVIACDVVRAVTAQPSRDDASERGGQRRARCGRSRTSARPGRS